MYVSTLQELKLKAYATKVNYMCMCVKAYTAAYIYILGEQT